MFIFFAKNTNNFLVNLKRLIYYFDCPIDQVWDVKACEPIANYRAHHGRLLCTLWSALDPDIIYTGGDDFSAQGWKISQQTHKAPPVGRNWYFTTLVYYIC